MRTIYRAEPPWPHRVLILGGGFAGVETGRYLEKLTGRRDDIEVWLVNRENFSLFTPLLPEVCSGVLARISRKDCRSASVSNRRNWRSMCRHSWSR